MDRWKTFNVDDDGTLTDCHIQTFIHFPRRVRLTEPDDKSVEPFIDMISDVAGCDIAVRMSVRGIIEMADRLRAGEEVDPRTRTLNELTAESQAMGLYDTEAHDGSIRH